MLSMALEMPSLCPCFVTHHLFGPKPSDGLRVNHTYVKYSRFLASYGTERGLYVSVRGIKDAAKPYPSF